MGNDPGAGEHNGLITFFESVRAILQETKFRYWDGEANCFQFPVHLMLFNPNDGSYHAFLSKIVKEDSPILLSPKQIESQLSLLNPQHMLDWVNQNVHATTSRRLRRWLPIGKVDDPEQCSPEAGDQPMNGADVDVIEELHILLSSLPSSVDWDICGYYDRRHTARQPLGLSLWSFTPADGDATSKGQVLGVELKVFDRNSYSAPSRAAYQAKSTGLATTAKRWRCAASLHDGDYDDLQTARGALYEAYDGVYNTLRAELFPRSQWQNLLCDAVGFMGTHSGILFVDLGDPVEEGSVQFKKNEFLHSARLFRREVDCTLIPSIERLKAAEFDRKFYKDISYLGTELTEIAATFCRHINFLMRCEYCLLEVKRPQECTWRVWTWIRDARLGTATFVEADAVSSGKQFEGVIEAAKCNRHFDGCVDTSVEVPLGNYTCVIHVFIKESPQFPSPGFDLDMRSLVEPRRQLLLQKLQNVTVSLKETIDRRSKLSEEDIRAWNLRLLMDRAHEWFKTHHEVDQWMARPELADVTFRSEQLRKAKDLLGSMIGEMLRLASQSALSDDSFLAQIESLVADDHARLRCHVMGLKALSRGRLDSLLLKWLLSDRLDQGDVTEQSILDSKANEARDLVGAANAVLTVRSEYVLIGTSFRPDGAGSSRFFDVEFSLTKTSGAAGAYCLVAESMGDGNDDRVGPGNEVVALRKMRKLLSMHIAFVSVASAQGDKTLKCRFPLKDRSSVLPRRATP